MDRNPIATRGAQFFNVQSASASGAILPGIAPDFFADCRPLTAASQYVSDTSSTVLASAFLVEVEFLIRSWSLA